MIEVLKRFKVSRLKDLKVGGGLGRVGTQRTDTEIEVRPIRKYLLCREGKGGAKDRAVVEWGSG